MDSRRFDSLSRTLSQPSARRQVLALLATLPVLGGLFGILSPDETEGAGRRRRRKKRHKHGKGRQRQGRRGKHRKPRCTVEAMTRTCTGAPCGASDGCGGICTCPSGQTCCNGTCSECGCGQTRLSNGTCVTPCTDDAQCCAECANWQTDPTIKYCATGAFPVGCGTDGDSACPKGLFCTLAGFCTPACA
jgi:hypothetical protein